MLRLSFLLALTTVVLSSCDPIELNTEDGAPTFTLEMTADGVDYNFEAGVDNYFMQTDVIRLFGTTLYSGTLQRKVGTQLLGDELSLMLSFNVSEDVYNSTDPNHLQSFGTGFVPFRTLDDAALPVKEVFFTANYSGSGSEVEYTWDYGDGASTDYKDPIHAYAQLGTYIAAVTAKDNNQCQASAQNTVSFDNREDCYASIELINIGTTNVILEASSADNNPNKTYLWSDGSTASDLTTNIADSGDLQKHCVTITNSDGCTSVSCIGIIKGEDGVLNTCAVDMEEANYNRVRSSKQFNAVDITWVLKTPKEYSSTDLQQPSESYFEIISAEEYDLNEQGERTVKIDFEFSCVLYLTGGTDPILIENAKGSMAVAIP